MTNTLPDGGVTHKLDSNIGKLGDKLDGYTRYRKIILPLYMAVVRPRLACCVQFRALQLKEDIGKPKQDKSTVPGWSGTGHSGRPWGNWVCSASTTGG